MDFIEIQFSIGGQTKSLPSDHGYAMYSAMKQVLQESDQGLIDTNKLPPEVKLCSISGISNREGKIFLNRRSRLRLRCPLDQVQTWYRLLQNQTLNIRGHQVRLVKPQITLPEPCKSLRARLVTFKLSAIDHDEFPRYFQESCQKSLQRLEISGQATIDTTLEGDLARRALRIKQKKILGYGVVVEGLSHEESLKLQWHGLGGRQHFGCGWFYPLKENADVAWKA